MILKFSNCFRASTKSSRWLALRPASIGSSCSGVGKIGASPFARRCAHCCTYSRFSKFPKNAIRQTASCHGQFPVAGGAWFKELALLFVVAILNSSGLYIWLCVGLGRRALEMVVRMILMMMMMMMKRLSRRRGRRGSN